ncbi:MAG: hypothetical protein AAF485_27460, partial [Chloroflexota bacterium]
VKGVPCWPNQPLYEQIQEGDELQAQEIDLESHWAPWQDTEPNVELLHGEDFDLVLLGISVGALSAICEPILNRKTNSNKVIRQRWQAMIDNLETISLQSCQLWLNEKKTGWRSEALCMSTFTNLFNSALDTTHFLDWETWPQEQLPAFSTYFLTPLDNVDPPPPTSDHAFPDSQQAIVKENLHIFLRERVQHLWPGSVGEDGECFDYDLLVDLDERKGEARVDAQYWKASINPSERYVLATPNSDQYRLKSDESGFSNLYLTGDWINNGYFNVGCQEATIISGLVAAGAITGRRRKVLRFQPIDEAEGHPEPMFSTDTRTKFLLNRRGRFRVSPGGLFSNNLQSDKNRMGTAYFTSSKDMEGSTRPPRFDTPGLGPLPLLLENLPRPDVHLVGHSETYVVPVSLPRELIQPLLPPNVVLAPQPFTAWRQHPLLLMFGKQTSVYPELKNSLFPIQFNYSKYLAGRLTGGYHQVMVVVPLVNQTYETIESYDPYSFISHLFVNKQIPLLGNYAYTPTGQVAAIEVDKNSYRVNNLGTNERVISGSFTAEGEPADPSNFPEFTSAMPSLLQPNYLTKTFFGSVAHSLLDWQLKEAKIQAVKADIQLDTLFKPMDLDPILQIPSIQTDYLGAFQLSTKWLLSIPAFPNKLIVSNTR